MYTVDKTEQWIHQLEFLSYRFVIYSPSNALIINASVLIDESRWRVVWFAVVKHEAEKCWFIHQLLLNIRLDIRGWQVTWLRCANRHTWPALLLSDFSTAISWKLFSLKCSLVCILLHKTEVSLQQTFHYVQVLFSFECEVKSQERKWGENRQINSYMMYGMYH